MKKTNIIYNLGLSCLIAGFLLGFIPSKEYKQADTKPISHERECAVEVIYNEGRNTSLKEREAILDVVVNRTKSNKYPSTICEVVHQPWQFSYRNNLKSNARVIPEFQNMNSSDKKAYLEIEEIVDNRLMSGQTMPNVVLDNKVLHYHTKTIIAPKWTTKKSKQICLDNRFKHRYYAFVN